MAQQHQHPLTFVACSYCLHFRARRAVQLMLAIGLHRSGIGFAYAQAPRASLSCRELMAGRFTAHCLEECCHAPDDAQETVPQTVELILF